MWLQGSDRVALPLKGSLTSKAHTATLKILKVLEFNVQTLRSGVVVRDRGDAGLLFLRGSAGVIKSLVQPASIPSDFDQVTAAYTVSDGCITQTVMIKEALGNLVLHGGKFWVRWLQVPAPMLLLYIKTLSSTATRQLRCIALQLSTE